MELKATGFQWYRVWAMILRHSRMLPRELYRILSLMMWPFLDLFVWGFVSFWVDGLNGSSIDFVRIFVTSIVFWEVFNIVIIESGMGLLAEIWARNLVNLFCTGLMISEWLVAVLALSFITVMLVAVYACGIAWLIFGVNIFAMGWPLLPSIVSLAISGLIVGVFTMGLLVHYGPRIQSFVWMMGWGLAPFSGAFYPIEKLPYGWMKTISTGLPMTYVMESMRTYLSTGASPYYALGMSFILNIAYGAVAIWYFTRMFEKSRGFGLARLADE